MIYFAYFWRICIFVHQSSWKVRFKIYSSIFNGVHHTDQGLVYNYNRTVATTSFEQPNYKKRWCFWKLFCICRRALWHHFLSYTPIWCFLPPREGRNWESRWSSSCTCTQHLAKATWRKSEELSLIKIAPSPKLSIISNSPSSLPNSFFFNCTLFTFHLQKCNPPLFHQGV